MTEYTETIRRWAADSSRAGMIPDPDGIGEVGLQGEDAGKRLAVRFTVRIRSGALDDLRFQVFGCGFTIAACAAAADLAAGRPLNEVYAISAEGVEQLLGGLPRERSYCAELAVKALHAAIAAAGSDSRAPQSAVHEAGLEGDSEARVSPADPLYRALMDSPPPPGSAREDRHLFACLLAVAAQEPYGTAKSLGLGESDLHAIVQAWFPCTQQKILRAPSGVSPPEHNEQILLILLSHVPNDENDRGWQVSRWLARILAARTAHPGHLWRAMGLFERRELSAAISRHLPSLVKANSLGMRWKRYLFKELCDRQGALLCKAPECGVCSDYPMCFAPGE